MTDYIKLYSQEPATYICRHAGKMLLTKHDYTGDLADWSSLIRLLYIFELPVTEILGGIVDERYKIEEVFPVSEILVFLLCEKGTPYWVELVFRFLLDDSINVSLSEEAINVLQDRTITSRLPQHLAHRTRRIVNKSVASRNRS
ncbi:hypothetical protein [Chitinophaga pinensis]|uniref:Uncharacterized protein n=1 Tax=Chitinophaga pinensis (strain ATCC 43595 / DSM 2588 / LMG 13176 / NBRC 15968 / NCIMB 11800 / UQM 2034) TaxID=485918 RepID=A0A979GWY4_CHIPD|nr:hypothetical protein [Chitinophaga pinensis]ACU62209.1 hypothetical protein Cpin_4774 [Chitinophaga pinensis DSM 2588]